MPSFNIHIAVGKRYIEKHAIKEKEEFLKGIIAPDFEEKDKSHYTKKTEENSLVEHLKNKVSIEDFLKENKVDTDYQRGVLLHLLTDQLFFTTFFPKEYLENIGYKNFTRDLYTSYNETNPYIEEKYQIILSNEVLEKIEQNIKDSKKQKHMKEEKGNNILPIEKLEKFIEEMSNIDLEQYNS